jgi:tRNA pseudouridine55 synthase
MLVDKPAGVTSHDVVASIRRSLEKGTKVGHAGTLDPFATGLLIVLVGKATRAQSLFMGLGKTYEFTARFGAISTTIDPEGEIEVTGLLPQGDVALPIGEILQRPPAYSALKVNGRRAYQLAREGVEFELAERPVTIHEYVETSRKPEERSYRVVCSSGTYVRSLVADLGDAYCSQLRRTSIGPFSVASSGEELNIADALSMIIETVELDHDSAADVKHGRFVRAGFSGEGPFLLVGPDGAVALARGFEDGTLRPFAGLAA